MAFPGGGGGGRGGPSGGPSGDGVNLYAVLEIDRAATPEDVKRAYRRLALLHHPDKNNGNDDKFKEVQQAYEVLSDERKRTVYDQYGLMGVEMFEKYGADNPMASVIFNPRLLVSLFCCASVLIALAIIFLAFLSVQIDGVVTWTWATVFIPVWILDGIVAIPVIAFTVAGLRSPPKDPDADPDGDAGSADGDGDPAAANDNGEPRKDSKKRGGRRDRGGQASSTAEERLERRLRRLEQFGRIKIVGLFACVLAWQIVLVQHLDTGSPPWVLVWVPLFVAEGLNLIDNILVAILILTLGASEADGATNRWARILAALNQFRWWTCRAVLVIFIALRSADVVAWNWALVALPLFVGVAAALLVNFGVDYGQLRRATAADERTEIKRSIVAKAVGLAVVLLLAFSFIGMVIVRLNQTSPPAPLPTEDPTRTVAVILTPLYIVASFFFCCCCCCLPCLVCMRKPGDAGGEEVDEVARLFRHRPQLYIEGSRHGPQPPWTVNMV